GRLGVKGAPQRAQTAGEVRFHRAGSKIEQVCDRLDAQVLVVTQHQHGALWRRETLQGGPKTIPLDDRRRGVGDWARLTGLTGEELAEPSSTAPGQVRATHGPPDVRLD